MERVSLNELIEVSRLTAYRDMDTILEIFDSLNACPMKLLLKGSSKQNYNFVNIYTPLNLTKEDIYNMSFLEFAYHLFDPRLEAYWKESSIEENQVLDCITLSDFFLAFSKENLLFKQFSMVSLVDYLDLMDFLGEQPEDYFEDREVFQEEPLAVAFSKKAQDLKLYVNPTIPMIDIINRVRWSFSNCAFMDRARTGYQLFRIVFHDAYKKGSVDRCI